MTPPILKKEEINYNFISGDSLLGNEQKYTLWILNTIREEGKTVSYINFIFCDDTYLLEINKKYLNHDDLTDIISFPYNPDPIESDIFISLERVEENANKFRVPVLDELRRVMIHGILHLCGYADKSEEEKSKMRQKENYYLEKSNF